MPRCVIDDGYTLKTKTRSTYLDGITGRQWDNLPVAEFAYRPALNPALYNLQYEQQQQTSGEARLDIQAEFIRTHLVSWDVVIPGNGVDHAPAPITVGNIKRLPPPIYAQILDAVTKWAPKYQGESEKNSASASV